jgi:hypothetical protein
MQEELRIPPVTARATIWTESLTDLHFRRLLLLPPSPPKTLTAVTRNFCTAQSR